RRYQPVINGELCAWGPLRRDEGDLERDYICDGRHFWRRWHQGEWHRSWDHGNTCKQGGPECGGLCARPEYANARAAWHCGGYCGARSISRLRRCSLHHLRDRQLRWREPDERVVQLNQLIMLRAEIAPVVRTHWSTSSESGRWPRARSHPCWQLDRAS